jgi:subtilase family serine protease
LSVWASTALEAGAIAGVVRVRPAPTRAEVTVLLALKIDGPGLAAFATAVSTPGSAWYGDYQSVSSIARRFGAPAARRRRVISYLRHEGAAAVAADRAGLYVSARLPVARARRVFAPGLSSFRVATGPGAARSITPEGATRVPGALVGDVTEVVDLDSQRVAQAPLSVRRVAYESTGRVGRRSVIPGDGVWPGSAYEPRSGTPSGCAAGRPAGGGFTPNQYVDAYGLSALHAKGFTGRGERVALLEIAGYMASDVKRFASCYELPAPHVQAFRVGVKRLLAPDAEATLDLEMLSAAAPKLSQVDIYESRPTLSGEAMSLTEAIESRTHRPDVISISLGGCETGSHGIGLYETALEMAAATGISVVAASGDSGSSACFDHTTAVNFPASSPFVTAVGGTNIHLTPANQLIPGDSVVWNDGPVQRRAGGGGESLVFPQPSYQDGFQTSGSREVPDVSMLADDRPGYEIYCTAKRPCTKHGWLFTGGTSASAPLLAGGIALTDQALRRRGLSEVGFANPLLYAMASSNTAVAAPATATSVFSDIIAGSNDVFATTDSPLGCCTTAPGYDDASGLGQVNVANLTATAKTMEPRSTPR